MRETLVLDQPEQLKALGHPLRVRTLELLGHDPDCQLTNRELARRLGVDPGHLHFHVKMLLRAGLIELAEPRGTGRQKPYRSVAKTIRVDPDLLAAGGAAGMQAAILDEVQRGLADYGSSGRFRSAQVTIRMSLDRAAEFITEALERADAWEDGSEDQIVLTMFASPPTQRTDR
ncbi:MAG: ArsR/SmtB family transcription factor [Gaiellaceae bacterium]